jgi:hypothetical protein
MTEEFAFTLPKEFVKALYKQTLIGFVIGGIFAVFLLPFNIFVLSLGVFGLLFCLLYWYTLQYKYVFVSSSYLRGKSYFLKRLVTIAWSEEVIVTRKSTREGIDGYEVIAPNTQHALFLPEAIALDANFGKMIARYASVNHPLLTIGKRS